jgi:hypothetical protein
MTPTSEQAGNDREEKQTFLALALDSATGTHRSRAVGDWLAGYTGHRNPLRAGADACCMILFLEALL